MTTYLSIKNKYLSVMLLCVASQLAIAGEPGLALKADQLRADAFNDAKVVGSLTANEKLEIMNKKGAWLQVKTSKQTGWVRLLSVKRQGPSGSAVAGIAGVATGRSGTGKVVSTTGIRGLSADEIKSAPFSEPQISKMESYAVSADDAKRFANAGGLTANTYPYLQGVAK
jgi:Bacterial SH3 domain